MYIALLTLKLSMFNSYRLLNLLTLRCKVQADCTTNNQYFLETLTNLGKFFRFRNSDDSTIFNNFQLNKYANLIAN